MSPSDWNLAEPGPEGKQQAGRLLGMPYQQLEECWRNAVYRFVLGLYDDERGALHHYYRADTRTFGEVDGGNFLMALNFLAMFDRYGDEEMLERAERCHQWAYRNCAESHPMFTWQGGVRDTFKPNELYVKYTCDALLTCLALYRRTRREEYLLQAHQMCNFLKGARQAGFSYKYDTATYRWSDVGFSWNGFGGPVLAYLASHALVGNPDLLEQAVAWGEHGRDHQAEDGGFYLLDWRFWNSDLTALELRALVSLYEVVEDRRYLEAAVRFADWLLARQRPHGAWPIGIDREGEVRAPHVGPGDASNIGLSLLRLHRVTGVPRYLEAAVRAVRYGISMQVREDGAHPVYLDNPHVRWGFWSWDPPYDFSLSPDQSVHHIRGMMVTADYLGSSASSGERWAEPS